jgi:signal transduction histidine kinase
VVVNTDETLLTRMLENLLSNAVKYTQQGSVGLEQSLEGAQVVVRVRDTGPGIPAEALDRVFDPFYRVPGIGDAGRGDGTGLGLAIARRYASAVGATIEVHSEPGRGTTFTLRLKRT